MPWTKISAGHFQRKIGENEAMIKLLGDRGHPLGREHWSISSVASFTTTGSQGDLVPNLRQAWKTLRFEHPSIASVANGGMLEYFVPNSLELDQWANDTFFVVDGKINMDELIATFKPQTYVTLHYLPQSHQIVLHSSHWRMDAIGAQQLLNAFFEKVASHQDSADLSWGTEQERLVPSIEEALNIPMEATPEIHAEIQRLFGLSISSAGGIGISYLGDEKTLPGGTRNARLVLPESTTEAIFKACEKRNYTVTGAVHAAVAAINYVGASPESKDKHYTSTLRFNLRPYLPKPFSTPSHASVLYTSGIMTKVSASQSWADNANQYSEEYRRGVTNEFLQARRQFALQMQEILKTMPPLRPSEIDISSLEYPEPLLNSVHEGERGSVEVLSTSVRIETLTRQLYCCVGIFRNKLELNLCYNEVYHDAERVAGLLGNLQEIFEVELLLKQ